MLTDLPERYKDTGNTAGAGYKVNNIPEHLQIALPAVNQFSHYRVGLWLPPEWTTYFARFNSVYKNMNTNVIQKLWKTMIVLFIVPCMMIST